MTTIFTFWEPRDALVPYLALCMKTWERALHAYDVVVLDYQNLPRYLEDGALDLETLRRLPLQMQKDAVMVAVLHRHGGLFLDADTLAVADIAPFLAFLDRSETVSFDMHLACVAARPGARLLDHWLGHIRGRLAVVRQLDGGPPNVPGSYLGNEGLYSAMDDIIDAHESTPFPLAAAERAIGLGRPQMPLDGRRTLRARLLNGFLWRRRLLYFRTIHRKRLTMLERNRFAFMPERLHRPREAGADDVRYRRYWFESNAGVDTAVREGQMLIGLHNSFTPDWYKRLSEAEVLAHPCLLSRTLRRLLDR